MSRPRIGATLAALATAATLGACGRQAATLLGPNVPPEIEILDARSGGAGTGVRVQWAARDPDGRVDHYEWALTEPGPPPRAGDWTACAEPRWTSRAAGAAAAAEAARAPRDPRLFSVRAVDAGGAKSERATVGLFGTNIAPTVQITCPTPSVLNRVYLGSNPTIQWVGNDPDGVYSTQPVKYKYKLLTSHTEVTLQTALADPDSVRRYWAPLAWAGWDSTSGDTTSVSYQNLIPEAEYMFVVVAFDEQGDYSVVFSRDTNMLYMRIIYPNVSGPVFSLWTDGLLYTYPTGGWSTAANRVLHVEVPAGAPLVFNWFATPAAGSSVAAYRWVLDPVNLFDPAPRSNELTDVQHWSQWSLNTTSCALGPFSPPVPKRELHTLYVEVADNTGCGNLLNSNRSLAILQFVVVPATFRKSLLVVDDTRLLPDRVPVGQTCVAAPSGAWPTAAELDTFLYAAGGKPWQCYPGGTLTSPGVFAGYAFDTVGTRGYPGGTVPLAVLANYEHVVWYTDQVSASYTSSPTSLVNPTTALRYMSSPGRQSTLAAYARLGGELWLAGGGAAAASLLPYDRAGNNSGRTVFSSLPQWNELGPGRFMYDGAHLRSEISLGTATRFDRSLGRFASSPGSYATLPLALTAKTAGTDPLPPLRVGGNFYLTTFGCEFVSQPNEILEGFDETPALDTLFAATVSGLGAGRVAATLYHGADNGRVLFTGFDFWHFQRTQCIELVDWVLQALWGLPRDPVARAPQSAAMPVAAPGAPAARPALAIRRTRL